MVIHTISEDGNLSLSLDISNMSVEDRLRIIVPHSENYNVKSKEAYDKAKVILGNSNGIINPNGTNHQWAYTIYKNMQKRDWVPEQVNTSEDKNNYVHISDQQKRLFHLVLAQLITNDSVQTSQLPKISDYITCPVISMALTRHAYEEANHSVSYAVMEADVICKPGYIYNLYMETENQEGQDLEDTRALLKKNDSVAYMYSNLYDNAKDAMTVKDILMIMVANQILEELVFPGGFVAMYTLEKQLPGTVKMIEEINVSLPAERSVA